MRIGSDGARLMTMDVAEARAATGDPMVVTDQRDCGTGLDTPAGDNASGIRTASARQALFIATAPARPFTMYG